MKGRRKGEWAAGWGCEKDRVVCRRTDCWARAPACTLRAGWGWGPAAAAAGRGWAHAAGVAAGGGGGGGRQPNRRPCVGGCLLSSPPPPDTPHPRAAHNGGGSRGCGHPGHAHRSLPGGSGRGCRPLFCPPPRPERPLDRPVGCPGRGDACRHGLGRGRARGVCIPCCTSRGVWGWGGGRACAGAGFRAWGAPSGGGGGSPCAAASLAAVPLTHPPLRASTTTTPTSTTTRMAGGKSWAAWRWWSAFLGCERASRNAVGGRGC